MAKTKYFIVLNEEEKALLQQIIAESEDERLVMRARILLETDEINRTGKCSVEKLAARLGTTHTTVQTVRANYGKGGVECAVYKKHREVSMTTRKINEDVIRKIWALSEEEPPIGYKKWSLKLLCKECVGRGIVDHIVPTSMSKVLKQKENGIEQAADTARD